MAHLYEDKQLIEAQAASGRISVKSAVAQVRELMETEADRLEKMADALHYQPGMPEAYRTKARELRDSIPAEVNRVVVKATTPDLTKVVSRRTNSVERRATYAGSPAARPIGMPERSSGVQADVVKSIGQGPDNRPSMLTTTMPVSQMTNEQKAAYYGRLVRESPTPADARMWTEMSQKYAEAAREERN